MKDLTKRQRETLEMIIAYKTECGFYPSYRDLCEMLDIESPNGVSKHIKALEKKGYLQKTGIARSFIIIEQTKKI